MPSSGDGTVRLWDTEPLARRHQARCKAEPLWPEAERLFAQSRERRQVVARLQADQWLTDPLRHEALQAVMRRGE